MNHELQTKIANMTSEELYAAVYMDPLTGALNRRAWEELGYKARRVVLIDLDSLKFINDNIGYRAGDKYLVALVEVLQSRFADRVYRLAGDEFLVVADTLAELIDGVGEAQAEYPVFSWGVGSTLDEADKALKAHKAAREATGERAGRGERPGWLAA